MSAIFDSRELGPDARDNEVARLRVPPNSNEAEQSVLGGLLLDNLAWDRAGPNTHVEAASNALGGFQTVATVTNGFAWTNGAPASDTLRAFYRVSQRE